jgi:hypothetical protein
MSKEYLIDPAVLVRPKRIKEPYSWIGHIPFAFYLVKSIKPKILVELGTHSGNSYFSFCQAVDNYNTLTKCFAVDTWEGDQHSGFYGKDVLEDVSKYNDKYYKDFSRLSIMTFDDAVCHFYDGTVDILHIDGLHTYEAVKHDFEKWLPKMSEKGVILLHDTQVKKGDFGVWKLWEEIKFKFTSIEFKHSNGLGVLFLEGSNNEVYQETVKNKHFYSIVETIGDSLIETCK